jgi:hypothetical protein
MMEGSGFGSRSGSKQIMTYPDPEVQKHTDPDPQHLFKNNSYYEKDEVGFPDAKYVCMRFSPTVHCIYSVPKSWNRNSYLLFVY